MPVKKEPEVPVDTRTPYQFAEDARRRELCLPPIIRPMPSPAPAKAALLVADEDEDEDVPANNETAAEDVESHHAAPQEVDIDLDLLAEKVACIPKKRREVLQHLAAGLESNDEIAKAAGIGKTAVNKYLVRIYRALDITHIRSSNKKRELAKLAYERFVKKAIDMTTPEPEDSNLKVIAEKLKSLDGRCIELLKVCASGIERNRKLEHALDMKYSVVSQLLTAIYKAFVIADLRKDEKRPAAIRIYRQLVEKKLIPEGSVTASRNDLVEEAEPDPEPPENAGFSTEDRMRLQGRLNRIIDAAEATLEMFGLKRIKNPKVGS